MSGFGNNPNLPIDDFGGFPPLNPTVPTQVGDGSSFRDGVYTGFIESVRRNGAIVYGPGATVPDDFAAPENEISYDIRFWPSQGINGGFNNVKPSQPRQKAIDIRPSPPGVPIIIHVQQGALPKFQCFEADAFEPCPPP